MSPRYIGPYQIIKRVGRVAYRLELRPELARVHNVFHVSMLHHYVSDPSHVILPQQLEISPDLRKNHSYGKGSEEEPFSGRGYLGD